MQRSLSIGYLSGPVDGVAVYEARKMGHGIDYLGTSYLREFFDVCEALGARAVVITSDVAPQSEHTFNEAVITNFPKPRGRSGLGYHRDIIVWTWRCLNWLEKQQVDVVVLTDVQDYWFLIAFHRLRRTRQLPALHCVLETPFSPIRFMRRLLHTLTSKLFYRRLVDNAIVASPMIERQAQAWFGKRPARIAVFLPTYKEEDFAAPLAVFPSRMPFVIVSAGRIEANKGAFDIVEMAGIIERRGDVDFRFEVCGTGSSLDDLRRTVVELGLEHRIKINGYCGRDMLLGLFAEAHAVIVPTRSTFEEGFAMICAEAILAGRPLITSRVCPALELVKGASLEAAIDEPQSYADAICALALDEELLKAKRSQAKLLRQQFLDRANGYGGKLEDALRRALAS